jgi:hypothetical protein
MGPGATRVDRTGSNGDWTPEGSGGRQPPDNRTRVTPREQVAVFAVALFAQSYPSGSWPRPAMAVAAGAD